VRFIRRSFVVVVVFAGLFMIGMRRNWPPVLNAVRRASRALARRSEDGRLQGSVGVGGAPYRPQIGPSLRDASGRGTDL
jgi:hypothetical protein